MCGNIRGHYSWIHSDMLPTALCCRWQSGYSVKLILLTGDDVIVTSSQLISLYFISSCVRTNTLYQVICLQLMIFSTMRHILLSPLPVATGVVPVFFCLVTELPLVKLLYSLFFASWWESLLRCVYGSHAHFITPCHRNFLMYLYDLWWKFKFVKWLW